MVDAPPEHATSHESQLTSLRAELKEWEHEFAAKNGGRKAGREDIKRDAEIAAKYKAYSRLRESSSTAADGHDENSAISPRTKKRKIPVEDDKQAVATPRKSSKQISTTLTPSKQTQQQRHEQLHPSNLDPYDSPSHVRTFLTPSHHNRQSSVSPLPLRNAIGPTPQRDGKALGLFDLLSASGKSKSAATPLSASAATPSHRKRKLLEAETPSKKRGAVATNGDGNDGYGHGNNTDGQDAPFTPSAQRGGAGVVRTRRYSMTPVSSAKKFYLSRFFASPGVGRFPTIPEEGEGENNTAENNKDRNNTSSKPKSNNLETPSFLRRRSLFSSRGARRNNHAPGNGNKPIDTGNSSGISPAAVRMPPRVMGKGLSTLVQGLRDMEDKQMDDDMDVLNEIEEEEQQKRNNENGSHTLVEDSQLPTNPEAGAGAEESPSKTRKSPKKKGQKRTTRLVTMRPNRAPPKPQPQWEDIPEESEDELAAVSTTGSPAKGVPESRGLRSAAADPRKKRDDGRAEDAEQQDYSELDNDDSVVKGKSYEDDDFDDEDFAPPENESESIVDAISKSRKRGYSAVKRSLEKVNKNKSHKNDNDRTTEAETKKTKTKKEKKEKKVNPNAHSHANYRALKIRSRGGGGGAGKGRFGGGGRFRRR